VPELAETLCDDGVTEIEVTPLIDTVTLVDPLTVAEVAWIEAVPEETPVTNPPFVVTVATVASVVLQETEPVMVLVLPSSYVPVAVICWVCPTRIPGVGGVTVMVCRTGSTKKPSQPSAKTNRKRTVNDRHACTLRREFNIPSLSLASRPFHFVGGSCGTIVAEVGSS